MSKEKQIIEIKECIDSVYGADCAYFDVDGFAIANEIYNAGYRKQIEGEWKFESDPINDPKGYFIRIVCPNCGLKTGQVSNFCPQCGAKMKGGADGGGEQ